MLGFEVLVGPSDSEDDDVVTWVAEVWFNERVPRVLVGEVFRDGDEMRFNAYAMAEDVGPLPLNEYVQALEKARRLLMEF